MTKIFKGQYSDEEVLFMGREHWLSFLLHTLLTYLPLLLLSAIVAWVAGLILDSDILAVSLFVALALVPFAYFVPLYRQTHLIITTRRVIKSVRHGFFLAHLREIRFDHISQMRSDRAGWAGYLFGYGHIDISSSNISGGSVYFRGIRRPESIIRYLSRVVDYIRLHGHTNAITPYMTDEQRKRAKQSEAAPESAE